jgi:hypothetical protein
MVVNGQFAVVVALFSDDRALVGSNGRAGAEGAKYSHRDSARILRLPSS